MTIRNRLLLSLLLTAVLFAALGSTLLFGYRYVSSQASEANSFDNMSKYLQMILRGVNEVILTEGTPQSVQIVVEGTQGFKETYHKLFSETNDAEMDRVNREKISTAWEAIEEGIKPFLEHHLDVEEDGLMIRYGKVISETDALFSEVNTLSEKTRSVVDSNSKKTEIVQYIILSALAVALLVILYTSYKLYQSILSPIQELNNIAEGFGNGNFDIVMDERETNEFGALAVHFNQATAKLSRFVLSLREEINAMSNSTEELSSKSLHIASNTKKQSNQTTHAAASMEELSSSFVEVARNASHAVASAKEATSCAVNGGEIVSETIRGMNRIAESVQLSAANIATLGKSSEQIGEIIKVINDIASQTNLLALNAAIEAARAGEQGRGFAVVADEVRKLAEKTTSSTNEIADMIKNIQIEANKSVEAMETGTKDVASGVKLSRQAGNALNQIVEAVTQVNDMITQIATAAEEQSTTGEQVASSIDSVAGITHNTANDAELSAAYADQLNKMASDLKSMAGEFKLRRRAHDSKRADVIQPEIPAQEAEDTV